MRKHLLRIARALVVLAVLLCSTAGIGRLSAVYVIGSLHVSTILLAGIAAAAMGSLAYLIILVELDRRQQ